MAGKLTYRLLGVMFAVPTSIAIKKTLDTAWRRSRGSDPPKNPGAPDTGWAEALTWAAISGVAIAAGQVVANRGATATYRAITGREPPGLERDGRQPARH